jgi:hypothetical protein
MKEPFFIKALCQSALIKSIARKTGKSSLDKETGVVHRFAGRTPAAKR